MLSAIFLLGDPETPRGPDLRPIVQNNEESVQHTHQQLQVDICHFCKGAGVDPIQDGGLTKVCHGVGKIHIC